VGWLIPLAIWLGLLAVKSSALLALAALVCLLLRNAGAAQRHFVWTSAFAAILLLPLLEAVVPVRFFAPVPLPAAEAPVTPSQPMAVSSVAAEVEFGTIEADPLSLKADPVEVSPATSPPPSFEWSRLLPGVALAWVCGLAVCIGRLVFSSCYLRGVARRTSHSTGFSYAEAVAKVGVRRRWRFVLGTTAKSPGPMTWGAIKPTIFFPETSSQWTPQRFESVLIHELTHVRRNDCLAQAIGNLACALLWFNPLTWVALRQLRQEAEAATDSAVLRCGVKPSDYADALLQSLCDTRQLGRNYLLAGVPLMKTPKIDARIRAILNPKRQPTGVTPLSSALSLGALLAAALPCAAFQSSAQPASSIQTSKSSQSPQTAKLAAESIHRAKQHTIRIHHASQVAHSVKLHARLSHLQEELHQAKHEIALLLLQQARQQKESQNQASLLREKEAGLRLLQLAREQELNSLQRQQADMAKGLSQIRSTNEDQKLESERLKKMLAEEKSLKDLQEKMSRQSDDLLRSKTLKDSQDNGSVTFFGRSGADQKASGNSTILLAPENSKDRLKDAVSDLFAPDKSGVDRGAGLSRVFVQDKPKSAATVGMSDSIEWKRSNSNPGNGLTIFVAPGKSEMDQSAESVDLFAQGKPGDKADPTKPKLKIRYFIDKSGKHFFVLPGAQPMMSSGSVRLLNKDGRLVYYFDGKRGIETQRLQQAKAQLRALQEQLDKMIKHQEQGSLSKEELLKMRNQVALQEKKIEEMKSKFDEAIKGAGR
jgi:beta-lactamase regulating signal transducer with metallopeptidase domain